MARELSLGEKLSRDGGIFDVVVVGAGPVGLALALALGRRSLHNIAVIDKRPPPTEDRSLRPQLLVARRADLGNLAWLGVLDERLLRTLSLIEERIVYDPFAVDTRVTKVDATRTLADIELEATWGDRRGIGTLLSQPPAALLPIGSLQLSLYEALAALDNVQCFYGVEATRLRRHVRQVSVELADAPPLRARLAIVATGSRRDLLDDVGFVFRDDGETRRVVAGLYARESDVVRWTRTERPWRPHPTVRTMLLEARRLTALLCEMPPGVAQKREASVFRGVAAQLGLADAPDLGPSGFDVRSGAVRSPVIVGDGRAPVIALGDAALTSHVFSGSVGFVNLALALELADALAGGVKRARDARVYARYVKRFTQTVRSLHAAAAWLFADYAPGQWCTQGQPRRRAGASRATPVAERRGSL
ncbi:MAG: FAD-dependent oxidoreductase [Myxococcales bacterium]|nr:FAD-dependent oxidoreductase [Myxococcales bacterium]